MEEIRNLDIIIELAVSEDLGDAGDITSESIFTDNDFHRYTLVSKDEGVLCGVDVFSRVFRHIDEKVSVETYFRDGDEIKYGDTVARVYGPVISVLKSERIALNFISHLSGIATKTAEFVRAAEGKLKILDTRKTLPGYRELQKYAVRCGGGRNHRMGLYDMVMIKDNHIDAAGSIGRAVDRVRAMWGNRFRIEVETRNHEEVQQALESGADIIMLDNMSVEAMAEAVEMIRGRAETEASGNMNLEKIRSIKNCGIDYVSLGELTHTVKIFDFSLKEA